MTDKANTLICFDDDIADRANTLIWCHDDITDKANTLIWCAKGIGSGANTFRDEGYVVLVRTELIGQQENKKGKDWGLIRQAINPSKNKYFNNR